MLKRIALILTTCATFLAPTITQAGLASWYGPGFHGKRTANGEIFNQIGVLQKIYFFFLNKYSFNLDGLVVGQYFVKITTSKGIQTKTLILKE